MSAAVQLLKDALRFLAPVGLALIVGAGARFVLQGQLDVIGQGLLAAGAVLILAYLLAFPAEAVRVVRARQARYGSNTGVLIAAVAGILVAANILGSRYHYRWDLTRTGRFTLTEQTRQILAEVKAPLRAYAFYTEGVTSEDRIQAEDLLKEYKNASPYFDYEFIDPDREPSRALQYNVRMYGTVVFEYQGRRQEATSPSEQQFTSAILRVVREAPKKVYFLVGHGERDSSSFDRPGYSEAKRALEANSMKVETLNLTTAQNVPDDADAVVVAGPNRPALAQELDALSRYLARGGGVVVLAEPDTPQAFTEWLARYGVQVGPGVVVDPGRAYFGDPLTPVVDTYEPGPITRNLGATVFAVATAVSRTAEAPTGLVYTDLFKTTDQSWLETDRAVARYDPGVDRKGPLTLGLTVEGKFPAGEGQAEAAQNGRLVVVGDADFAANQWAAAPGNNDLFLRLVSWAAKQQEGEQLVSIPPRPSNEPNLILTSQQQNLVFLSSVVFLPAIVLLLGAIVWYRRR